MIHERIRLICTFEADPKKRRTFYDSLIKSKAFLFWIRTLTAPNIRTQGRKAIRSLLRRGPGSFPKQDESQDPRTEIDSAPPKKDSGSFPKQDPSLPGLVSRARRQKRRLASLLDQKRRRIVASAEKIPRQGNLRFLITM